MAYKNIPVTEETKKEIDRLAKKSESYDEFILKVLEFYEEYQNFKEYREFQQFKEFKQKQNGGSDG